MVKLIPRGGRAPQRPPPGSAPGYENSHVSFGWRRILVVTTGESRWGFRKTFRNIWVHVAIDFQRSVSHHASDFPSVELTMADLNSFHNSKQCLEVQRLACSRAETGSGSGRNARHVPASGVIPPHSGRKSGYASEIDSVLFSHSSGKLKNSARFRWVWWGFTSMWNRKQIPLVVVLLVRLGHDWCYLE